MDITKLKRDHAAVKKALTVTKDGKTIAKQAMSIHVPVSYKAADLFYYTGEAEFLAAYALVVGDKYLVDVTPMLIRSKPSDLHTVTINEVDYYVLEYQPGDEVLTGNQFVKLDTVSYLVWNQFIDRGRVPWFMGYDDKLGAMLRSLSHSGANLGDTYSIFSMIASVTMRDKKDRTKHLRYTLQKNPKAEPYHVGLRNILYTAETSSAKLTGSYADIGLTSDIVNPSQKPEGIEEILLE